MPLQFNNVDIPGICMPPSIGTPAVDVVRTKFKGVNGDSEIRGGRGGRMIEYPVAIFDTAFSSFASVQAFLDKLDSLVCTNGTLKESGTITRTWKDCTFEGFDNQGNSILPIIGVGMTGSYWIKGVCRWYQLSIAETNSAVA